MDVSDSDGFCGLNPPFLIITDLGMPPALKLTLALALALALKLALALALALALKLALKSAPRPDSG
ncbi:hypothetical protein QUF72_14760 [Desulfobacterales bacterium HSG2]|nr:hypothetical protein [Desulfobacterales bacterium HSG2]